MVIRDLAQTGPTNRGGSYVKQYNVHPAKFGGHKLMVIGPAGAITQVTMTDNSYGDVRKVATLHTLESPRSQPTPAVKTLLDLLGGAVTVPCHESVDFAIALDWFKKVVDGSLAGHTDLAELVTRGKDYSKRPEARDQLRAVGAAVVAEMVGFAAEHPLLKGVDAIASVPGHDARVLSFGSSLAYAVARELRVSLIRCRSIQDYRAPAKEMGLADRSTALAGQFRCPVDVSGQRVLIIDDVYSTGSTVQETARALRMRGASRVSSLAAVRTMRSL